MKGPLVHINTSVNGVFMNNFSIPKMSFITGASQSLGEARPPYSTLAKPLRLSLVLISYFSGFIIFLQARFYGETEGGSGPLKFSLPPKYSKIMCKLVVVKTKPTYAQTILFIRIYPLPMSQEPLLYFFPCPH